MKRIMIKIVVSTEADPGVIGFLPIFDWQQGLVLGSLELHICFVMISMDYSAACMFINLDRTTAISVGTTTSTNELDRQPRR